MTTERWKKVTDAAREADVLQSTIYKYIHAGTVDARKIGKFWHVEMSSLLATRANVRRPGRPPLSERERLGRALDEAEERLEVARRALAAAQADYNVVKALFAEVVQ